MNNWQAFRQIMLGCALLLLLTMTYVVVLNQTRAIEARKQFQADHSLEHADLVEVKKMLRNISTKVDATTQN